RARGGPAAAERAAHRGTVAVAVLPPQRDAAGDRPTSGRRWDGGGGRVRVRGAARVTAATPGRVEQLTRRGLRLAQLTVAYNVAEGAIAITAGLMAGLVSVVGFGIDSAIESIAAV